MLVSEDFKRKILANRDLPTLPIIAQKILTLRSDDESLAEKLGSIISSDQSMSAKDLTLANSACYGHLDRIGTIRKAVVVIGVRPIDRLPRLVGFHNPANSRYSGRS